MSTGWLHGGGSLWRTKGGGWMAGLNVEALRSRDTWVPTGALVVYLCRSMRELHRRGEAMSQGSVWTRVEAEKQPPVDLRDTVLLTQLGLVEGDVLTYLEGHGPTSLRGLIRGLDWPSQVVTMGVGALIREGLVQGRQRELEVLIAPKILY